METATLVKENKLVTLPLSWRWLCAGLAASACALCVVTFIDTALPEPLTRHTARPDQFIAENAYGHLVNLTSIGPRVAGSYENEVLSVAILVSAVKSIALQASPHNRVELDVQRASGSFALTFMDGMNNVYRDVQSVVVRVSGAGTPHHPRTAILLNCHFDTVPDSPGASDDGAGCAVLLETLRALAASTHPLRHDAVFLFNGAEENILQASHAFITQHKWAKSVRAFINLEACGAGGREVLFQAGPHDPWIMEVYAGAVPHPFASSLAQELFESGLIPADTDFRIFRDFGKLSGVDLAWSANGYVYHTRLDTVEQIPRAALQRTGDNVLALARGLLSSASIDTEVDQSSRQPVFFDVLGALVVSARPPAALALALATLALVLIKLNRTAIDANKHLYVRRSAWCRTVYSAVCATIASCSCGVLAAVSVAALLHLLRTRLTFYARPTLLAPLYVAPALAACWAVATRVSRGGSGTLLRGWWRARAWHDAHAALAGIVLAACALGGLRSGFLPLLWALLPPAADVIAPILHIPRAAAWAMGAALPLLQTCYLLLNSLYMFVPIMGRAAAGAVPPDVVMAMITSSLTLAALSWLMPFVVATRDAHKLIWFMLVTCLSAVLLVLLSPLGGSYTPLRPQRLMLYHTRRTIHKDHAQTDTAGDRVEHFYWVPELDPNTRHTLDHYVHEAGAAREVTPAECSEYMYCGMPYFLPVLTLVSRSQMVPVAHEPRALLQATLAAQRLTEDTRALYVNVTRATQHVVLIVAPPEGAELVWTNVISEPISSALWGTRRTYFIALHTARMATTSPLWSIELHLRGAAGTTDVALAAHAMFGPDKLQDEHARTINLLPSTITATGWGADLHLYKL